MLLKESTTCTLRLVGLRRTREDNDISRCRILQLGNFHVSDRKAGQTLAVSDVHFVLGSGFEGLLGV